MSWSPVQKLSIGAGAALLVIALFGIVAFASVQRLATQQVAVADANMAIGKLDQLSAASIEAERSGDEFIFNGTTDALETFDQARSRAEEALDVLRQRSEDRPRERLALDSAGPLIGERFRALTEGIALRKARGAAAAAEYEKNLHPRVVRGGVQPLLQRMRDEELKVLAERTRLQIGHGKTAASVILLGSIIALVLAALAMTPVRPSVAARLTRRLTTPVGIPAIPEFAETARDATRLASDRLTRLQRLAYALDMPESADGVGDAIVVHGLGGMSPAATLVARVDGGAWHVVARRSTKVAVGSALAAEMAKPLDDVARSREPIVIENKIERDRLYPGLPNLGAIAEVAFVAVPLVANGKTFGALAVSYDAPHVFGDDERAFLATLGRMGGQALARIA